MYSVPYRVHRIVRQAGSRHADKRGKDSVRAGVPVIRDYRHTPDERSESPLHPLTISLSSAAMPRTAAEYSSIDRVARSVLGCRTESGKTATS